MEAESQTFTQLGFSTNKDDGKYLSGLSTVLVATIQEAKDRISQVEHIFCSELFPNFQLRSKIFGENFAEAKRVAEDDWRKKENSLLLQIEELRLEKRQALEQNQQLIASLEKKLMDNDQLLEEHKTKNEQLLAKLESLGKNEDVNELMEEIRQEAKKVAKGRRMQEKVSEMVDHERHLNEHDESKKLLLSKINSLEESLFEVQNELKQRTQEVAEGKEMQESLLKMLESNATMILKKNQLLEEHEKNKKLLVSKVKSLENNVFELQYDLKQKIEEVADGAELQEKLLKKLETNATMILNKNQLLDEHEEKKKMFLSRIKCLGQNVDELQYELRQKTEQVAELNELQEKLLNKVGSYASEIVNKDHLLNEHEENEKLLLDKIKHLEKNVADLQSRLKQKIEETTEGMKLQEKLLQSIESKASEIVDLRAKLESAKQNANELKEELQKKSEEVAEGRNLQEKLLEQIELKASEKLNNEKMLSKHEEEKKFMQEKVRNLELNVDEFQHKLRQKSEEVTAGKKLQEKLLQKVELYASQILTEKNKRKDVIVSFKNLKSQYNFLCRKFGLTTENMLQNRVEEETDSSRFHQNPGISQDPEKDLDTPRFASERNKQKNETSFQEKLEDDGRSGLNQHLNSEKDLDTPRRNKQKTEISFQEKLEDDGGSRLNQHLNSHSPYTSRSSNSLKCPISMQSKAPAGIKRPVSYWRDTRSHRETGGPDPHDDFLDTPMEIVRGNLNKAKKEDVPNFPVPAPEGMDPESSDSETQDIHVDAVQKRQQISILRPEVRNYKYVEPVRKKAARESLKGIECKQCKKFYDAVLPNGGGEGSGNNNLNTRCEHHDGISRHRYKYVPPMTPEGFWNIGFDSDM